MEWSPHFYRKEGIKAGMEPEFIDRLVTYADSLYKKNLPVLFTLKHLSEICNTNYTFLEQVIERKVNPYRRFQIKKRNGKNYRQICAPTPSIDVVQYWIKEEICSKLTADSASTAYAKNCSPKRNASIHCGAKWLVKVDIIGFFESISERQVYKIFSQAGYNPLLAFQLTRLVTTTNEKSKKYEFQRWSSNSGKYKIFRYEGKKVGHLPQGARTSPMLANLVCKDMDERIRKLAKSNGCEYTRYSDDIVFSTLDFNRDKAVALIKQCSKILSEYGFRRNLQKTQIVPPGARKIVTGLIVNGSKPSLSRKIKSQIENHLYFTSNKKFGLVEHCKHKGFRSIPGFYNHLKGLITYAKHINPELGLRYERKFNNISWPSFVG
jgi:RNA-directed DNA polymerase